VKCGMLPDQYGEEDDRYGPVRYVDRYGAGDGADLYSMGYGADDGYGVGVVAYGGSGYGADGRYGVDALLYGGAGDGYGSGYDGGLAVGERGDGYGGMLDVVDPFDYLEAAPEDLEHPVDGYGPVLPVTYRVRSGS
jgi:hypothetical protein